MELHGMSKENLDLVFGALSANTRPNIHWDTAWWGKLLKTLKLTNR